MTIVDNIVAGQFRQAANTIHTQGIASGEKFGAQIISILPKPLVPPDCDCTNLDGFMLNVERLMASELVAISSHERTCRCSDEMGKQETEKMNAAIIAALGFLAGFAGVLIWRLSKRTTK